MKKIVSFLIIIFSFSYNLFSQNACNKRTEPHLRIVGDSWAHFPALYHAYDSALAKYGFADYYSVYNGTALISMTAETWWQFPITRWGLETGIRGDRTKPIDIVMVSLGGNDVAFKIHSGDSLNVLDNNLAKAKLFMDSIFDFIHQTLPKAQIIWQCYDYPNFNDPCIDFTWDPYCDLWRNHGYPTAYEINRFMGYISDYQDSVIKSYNKPYMHFFNNLGLMQWKFGQTTPLRYPPYGTYPARSVPFPGGDIRYPSPHKAMGLLGIDTYHLDPQGFTYLAEFYLRKYIQNYLRRNRDTSFYSNGKVEDGWVDNNGTIGTGEIVISKSTIKQTKGIISINTATIPDDKKIVKASLFIRTTFVKNKYSSFNVFPENFKLDIKQGSFGSVLLEATDFDESATLSDIACTAGSLSGHEFGLRFDLHEDALKYINKTGITQFRLEISDTNTIKFFNGDTLELEGPYLDIYYDTTDIISSTIDKINSKKLSVFPNPAQNYITIDISEIKSNDKLNLSVLDIKGTIINTLILDNSKNQLQLNIVNLSKGEYFIKIENSTINWIGSFIKN